METSARSIATPGAPQAAAEPVSVHSLASYGLASFLDGIADIASIKDCQGRYLHVNAAAARLIGRPPAEIVGQDDFALFPAELAGRLADEDAQVLASGAPLTFEEEFHRDGNTLHLETHKSVCRDAAGAAIGIVAIGRDCGQRRQLEDTLRRRERELTEVHRIAGTGAWRYDCATGITTWSEEIYRIYGLEPGRPVEEYAEYVKTGSRVAGRSPFHEVFDRAIRFGEPYSIDIEITRPDGSKRWILARGEVEERVDGKVASLRGTVHDITSRKLAEREIALRENRYRSLVHATTQIVWVTNADVIQMGSIPAWQAFTGQSFEQVQGFGWVDAIHPDDRERTVHAWGQAIDSGNMFLIEHRLRRHDGVYRLMTARAVPVRDDGGQIVEWVGAHNDITDQRFAEEQSRLARERLQNVLDSFTDGLCVLDRDLTYIYFNENGARMVGLRPEQIVGTRVGETYAENKTNLIYRSYRHSIDTGEPVHIEEFSLPPLNKWFESNCYPSADGLTVYFRDITARKRTEQALRDSESRYRKLFESNMMGICRPDRFGAFKEGNDELLRITGYTREDLEAGLVRWDIMTPPEYAELDAAHIAEAARTGSCTPYEKEYIRKDGSRVPILCGFALLEGSEDEYVGFVIDISRQRAAEAELREREHRFRLLAESLPALVWVSDSRGSLTYLNSRFLAYCGIAPESMLGYNWQLILHPDEMERVNRAWSHSVATGEPYLIELRLRSHDGSYRHFLARALALTNPAGEVDQWVGTCTDVHDERLAEEALRRSEKLAVTGRLAASIAHEINNPLASVTNALYLALQDESVSAQTRGYLKTADQELARVSQITTQTLRFHRQSRSALVVDLVEIMQSVLALFRPRFAARQIDIQTEWEHPARICCFEDEIRQVFANLVSNALDATPYDGRLRIRIRNTQSERVAGELVLAERTPAVRVTVADSGCGIPPQFQKRIFEPFFSTKDATGIGLGLWVSEGILRKHGARMKFRTSTGPARRGTVFSILFPLTQL